MVEGQVSCDLPNTSQNDDKMANMTYQTKKNIHSTMPIIQDTLNEKTQSHAKNQKSSQTIASAGSFRFSEHDLE